MKMTEIKELTVQELNEKLIIFRKDLMNTRFKNAAGQADNPVKIRDIRKTVARIKTALRQHEGFDSKKAKKRGGRK